MGWTLFTQSVIEYVLMTLSKSVSGLLSLTAWGQSSSLGLKGNFCMSVKHRRTVRMGAEVGLLSLFVSAFQE